MSVRAEIGLALLLALGITIAVVAGARTGAPASAFEPASSYASGPAGSRAPFEVLHEVGVRVERRRSPLFDLNEHTSHHPRLLVILDLEPGELPLGSAEITQVANFVKSGGALLLAGTTGGIAPCLGWAHTTRAPIHADSFPVQPVSGVRLPPVVSFFQPRRDTLAPGEENRCRKFGGATTDTVVRTLSGRPVLLDLRYRGGGRIFFAADDGWFRNAAWKATAVPYVVVPLIRQAAGDGLVAFDEYHHGFASASAMSMAVSWLLDLEKDLVLPLELDFLVVESPRQQHQAVDPQEVRLGELPGANLVLGAGGHVARKIAAPPTRAQRRAAGGLSRGDRRPGPQPRWRAPWRR